MIKIKELYPEELGFPKGASKIDLEALEVGDQINVFDTSQLSISPDLPLKTLVKKIILHSSILIEIDGEDLELNEHQIGIINNRVTLETPEEFIKRLQRETKEELEDTYKHLTNNYRSNRRDFNLF